MRELLEKQLALCESGTSARKCLTSECKFMDDPYSCQIGEFIRFVLSAKPREEEFEKVEYPDPHSDREWPPHDDHDIYIKKKYHSSASSPKANKNDE